MLIKISFKYSFFIKIAKFQLNNFNRLVININGEQICGLGEGWVLQLLYNITGLFPEMLYRVGGWSKISNFCVI